MLWNKTRLKEALDEDLIFIDENYNYQIDNVVFDNRKVDNHSLFIAKKGENTDGHNFIEATLNNNQEVVVLANYDFNPKFSNNPRIILVKDTIKAMEKMARYARKTIKGKVIGITGSVGKTTTKELFYSCFTNYGKSYCNIMSFNNYFGVLTTLCNLPQETDYAIIEIGMNAKGEMERLSNIVEPDYTTILNITSAHLGCFNKEEEIAYAKAEIFKHQKKDGFTILNRDNKYFDILKDEATKNNIKTIYTFSEKNDADVVLKEYISNEEEGIYKAKYLIENKLEEFSLTSPDYNIASNLMSVLATIQALKLDFNKVKRTIEEFGSPRGRNNIEEAVYNGKKITLINGTYNAVNPIVFIKGLELMDKIAKNKKTKRKIAIFGDIREAGDKSQEFMLSLRDKILESKIDILICVGDVIKVLYDSLKNDMKTMYFKESTDVIPILNDTLEDNDLVFIKASKGIKTWKILDEITGYPTDIFL